MIYSWKSLKAQMTKKTIQSWIVDLQGETDSNDKSLASAYSEQYSAKGKPSQEHSF